MTWNIINFLKIFSNNRRKEKYIINLINRMSTVDNAKSSDDSVSFRAHREAELINDKEMIPIVIDLINNPNRSQDTLTRRDAYFILSKLLLKHENLEALRFLINQVKIESDRYVISSLLDRISELEKPETVDIEPIVQYIQNQNRTIRHSAIGALKKSRNPEARKVIVDILLRYKEDIKKNKYDIIYAVSTLSYIGNKDDLDLLGELSVSKIRDIRDSSIFAIESITKRQ
ncbi:HEAT repeat protein [Paenibacillus sp. V4I9]|uniref:HEAT repeat domain-containing protein n=1 Tax=Paenibacillus sp. V4I9 TaxID=3042308 RepID=UPI00277F6E5D|nr:HEAT repeat domain-containing protein [Paenibacillus sp. V4I9]MDQ0888561.1 HEAT repeat protein [Paenibacillus sp. V4I9]